MASLTELKETLGEETKDLRLNLDSVLRGQTLDSSDSRVIALASALYLRATDLAAALLSDPEVPISSDAVEDARASAAIMAMNTVYYRFRHMIGKETYQKKPAGLRMNRMIRPATSKRLFELCSMACAAIAGCEVCLRSHEESLIKEGATEDQIHEAVRIGAAIHGFAVAVTAGGVK